MQRLKQQVLIILASLAFIGTVRADGEQRPRRLGITSPPPLEALLKEAVRQDNVGLARALLEHGANPNAFTLPLVYIAIQNDSAEMAFLLLQYHANPHALIQFQNEDGTVETQSLLQIAEETENLAMLDTVLQFTNNGLIQGVTRLEYAVQNGLRNAARHFLDIDPSQVNVQYEEESRGLIHRATGNNDLLMLQLLLNPAYQAEINLRDTETLDTALNIAIENEFLDIFRLLLARGANANIPNNRGNTSLHTAVNLVYTFDEGPEGFDGELPDLTYLRELLSRGGVELNIRNHGGLTALHIATRNGDVDAVNALLEQEGIHVDAETAQNNEHAPSGSTALHIAALDGEVEILLRLLEAGANPHQTNENGDTPVMIVRAEGQHTLANQMEYYHALNQGHYLFVNENNEVILAPDRIYQEHTKKLRETLQQALTVALAVLMPKTCKHQVRLI